MFSQEQIRSGAPSFHRSNAIDDRNEARHVSKVNTDNCTFAYFYARECDRKRRRCLSRVYRKISLESRSCFLRFSESAKRPPCFDEGSGNPRPLSLPKVISAGNLSLCRESRRHFRPSETKKASRLRLARKIIGMPFYRVLSRPRVAPFSPVANPVDFFPEEPYGCASWRLLNVPTPRLIYSPGLSKQRNLDIYRPFPALR